MEFALETESTALYAQILVDGVSDLVLDYLIPSHMANVQPGCRVSVPLRHRVATGTVLTIGEKAGTDAQHLKSICKLIDPEPLITSRLMDLARWVADYYVVPLEQMIRCLLPETVRQERTNEKTIKVAQLLKTPTQEELDALFSKAPRQAAILDELIRAGKELSFADLQSGKNLSSIKSLQEKGWISIETQGVYRDPCADEKFVESQPLPLNPCQSRALESILSDLESEAPVPLLLQGVTGSGKTEVYLQAVEHVVKQGKSALILVPEISLTPQTLQRFKSRFASLDGSVAVLHSLLSAGERFDEWHAIRQGKARIVIGPRSAVFAPVHNLGIIIVDEEHDGSYKQESSPRYHGRDIAVLRAKLEHCTIVLGSATPSLESLANVQSGKYKLIRMDERADGQKLPLIRILDMRTEGKNKQGPNVISERLRMAVDRRLGDGEQVILLLNRRGFARSLQCPDCGFVMTCNHCSLPLTYHKDENRLICHMCGFRALTPRVCPDCQSHNILLQGYGTEKVEELLHKTFRTARIARIDADVSRRKNAVRDILRDFRAMKIDILLGTQMIAKGLDFPNVTLVGVLNADLGLYIPDLRAGERTFQLLTQVAGRAGRGDREGEVIIQTFTPESPSLQFARTHDCDGFAEQEMELRRAFDLPPYSHISLLTVRSTNERLAEFSMQTIYNHIKQLHVQGLTVTDPMPAPIPKAHGQFRFQVTLKASRTRTIAHAVRQVLSEFTLGNDVTTVLDIDAYSFM